MIRLQKGPKPPILAANGAEWTKDILSRIRRGEKIPANVLRRYAHKSVKDQAVQDSHGKCIYCESKIRHVSHGDLEHLKPKAPFPESTYDWANLGLVCTKCNGAKSDTFDVALPPVNPFAEEPSDFLVAVGELIWPRPANDRGTVTVSLVKLNRAELVEQRRRRLESIRSLIELVYRAKSDTLRAVFRDQLVQELDVSQEYAFVARAAATVLDAP